MRKLEVDCAALSSRELQALLADQLDFPDWYGHNLDALYDCLTELEEPTHLILTALEDEAFRQTLLEAEEDSSCLRVTLK